MRLLKLLARIFRIISKGKNERQLLIADIDNIGDILLLTPLLDIMKESFSITVVACPAAENVLKSNPSIKSLLIYDAYSSPIKKLFFFLKIFGKFDQAFSVATVWQTASFTNLCALISGAGYTKGRPHGKFHEFLAAYTDFDNSYVEYMGIKYCKEFAKSIPSPCVPRFYPDSVKINLPKPYIAIHPGGKDYSISRKWPKKQYEIVISLLHEYYGEYNIVLTGGKEDSELCSELCSAFSNPDWLINSAGKSSFLEWCHTIQSSRICLTNDSASIHIASALNTPCIAIMGPTSEKILISEESSVIPITAPVPCRPCWLYEMTRKECPHQYRCFSEITPDAVLKKIQNIMDRTNENS